MILLAVVSGFIWACSHEPGKPNPNVWFSSGRAVQVFLYNHGRIIRSGRVKGSSAFCVSLQSLIRGVSRWQFSVVDYAPSLVIDGTSFNINVLHGIIVVNYRVSKSVNAQITGVITKGAYTRLVQIAIAVTKQKRG